MTSSLYDPLGVVAPVTITPKIIQQDLCRLEKLGWDDTVPDDIGERWDRWLAQLTLLMELNIPRCFKPKGLLKEFTVELHHFCDASEMAYGAASYVKVYDANGTMRVSLVMGKARVAPIQPLTIPRLELSSAVTAVRLHEIITAELEYKIHKVYFWTDSMSNIKYIRNKTSRFKTFVSNRLSVIHEATVPSDWYYVPTKVNPADLASCGIQPKDQRSLEYWLHGPSFLQNDSAAYPEQPSCLNNEDPEQEIKNLLHVFAQEIEDDSEDIKESIVVLLLQSSSSWHKVQKRIGWLLRFQDYCVNRFLEHRKLKRGPLSVEEMLLARLEAVKCFQRCEFYEEIDAIKKGKELPRSSALLKLSPILENDVLRVGGRLEKADVAYDVKHPMIIPGKCMLAELIIRECHEDNGHVGASQVLAMLRQVY